MDDSISQSVDVDEGGMVMLHPLPPGPAREAMFLGVPGDVVDEFYARSLPFPPGMLTLMMEGTLVPFARDVRVPGFVGFGELDLAADPLDERHHYPSSPDVTVHVERGAGHFHNIAPTREELWAALFDWMWSRARRALGMAHPSSLTSAEQCPYTAHAQAIIALAERSEESVKVRINRVAGLAAALLCCSAVAACGSSSKSDAPGGSGSHTKSPVVFQLISAKTTGVDLLDPYKAGAQAAVKAINASGGFGGRKVVLDTCNSMLTPAGTTTCAHQAIANDPVAMWGCETNWSAIGLPMFAAKGIPSFNCLNTDEDFTAPTSFSIFPGGGVEFSAGAKYICTMPDVKRVAWIAQDDPGQMKAVPKALTPIVDGCGKTISYEWFPFSAVDVTPYVTKVMQGKPDFVMIDVSGAAMVNLVKAFEQQGLPSQKIYSTSVAMDEQNVLKPGGSALNGTLWSSTLVNWDQTSDPTIAAYRKATAGTTDPLELQSLWGWIQMYWFRTVAQHVGFANFDASSLMHFMKTANGVPIPGSRTLVNPGPAQAPALKQPYLQILRYVDGKFQLVTKNTDKGWINGVPKTLGG